jgi:hypothetical protein
VAQDRGYSLNCVLIVVAALDRSQVAVDGLRIKPAATHAHTVHECGIIWCQVSSFEGLLMQGSCVLEQAWRCLKSAFEVHIGRIDSKLDSWPSGVCLPRMRQCL